MSFKKFDGSTWQPITPKKLKGVPYTGTLPAVLTGTKAGYLYRYKIYGNTEQAGTPTPENPIEPRECGELETTGAHAGQYKLSLTSAGQNVDIYLGESQTTRRIKKLVLDGTEQWSYSESGSNTRVYSWKILDCMRLSPAICTHFDYNVLNIGYPKIGEFAINSSQTIIFGIDRNVFIDVYAWKSYLAAQYAAGTPVTVWYVLAEPETSTLNEPLRKIGDYADTIDSTQTSAQIPTSAGSTTIGWSGSGLAPSQFDSIQEWVDIPTYKRVNGEWVADN